MSRMKPTYYEKLKHPNWQKKRLEMMSLHGFKCCECGESDSTLNVHHLYYISGRDPWKYPNWCFVTLCEPCHKTTHSEPEEDEIRGFSEWEEALTMMLPRGKNMSYAGPGCDFVWSMGVEVAQALQSGISEKEILDALFQLRLSHETTD